MKVWIVQESCYHECEEILGVYSSSVAAQAAAREFAAVSWYPCEEVYIIEARVDEAIDCTVPRWKREGVAQVHRP